jgi:biopolymer transport protein TolR
MAFGTPQGGSGDESEEFAPLADINMTPFIDVMLVLLVIFMMTASILATGMKVDLPKAAAAKQIDNQKPVIVTLTSAGQIQVNGRDVTPESVAEAVRSELAGADRVIQIRGDQGVNYGSVVRVLDALIAAGMNKVALVADRANTPGTAAAAPNAPVAAERASPPPAPVGGAPQ